MEGIIRHHHKSCIHAEKQWRTMGYKKDLHVFFGENDGLGIKDRQGYGYFTRKDENIMRHNEI